MSLTPVLVALTAAADHGEFAAEARRLHARLVAAARSGGAPPALVAEASERARFFCARLACRPGDQARWVALYDDLTSRSA